MVEPPPDRWELRRRQRKLNRYWQELFWALLLVLGIVAAAFVIFSPDSSR